MALFGGALSFYFYAVYRSKMNGQQWWIPPFLQMSTDACTSVVDSPYGRHFGIANAAFGTPFMVLYAVLIFLTGINLITVNVPLYIGGITVVAGLYLVYGLIRIKTNCRICYTIHFLNGIIFIILLNSK